MFDFWGVLLIIVIFLVYVNLSRRINELKSRLETREQEHLEKTEQEKPQVEEPEEVPREEKSLSQAELQTEVEEEPEEVSEPTKERQSRLEFELGSKVFTIVGSIAVMMGAGFFLRYAFKNNLITEPMRVILGTLAGALLLFIGHYFRKKYPVYSEIVAGGGLGVLYLSMYANSSALYGLLPNPIVLITMGVVTGLGVLMSLHFDSAWLAGFSQIGGFIAPLLLSIGALNSHLLFVYLLILNLGILFLARKKLWIYLNVGNFLGTVLVYFTWLSTHYSSQPEVLKEIFALSQPYGSFFALLFLGTAVLQFLNKRDVKEATIFLLSGSSLFYFALTYVTVNELYPDWMGIATFGLGLFQFLFAWIVSKEIPEPGWFKDTLIALGCFFFIIGVPIQFSKHWVTIAWGAEALLMATLGLRTKSYQLRSFAHGVFWLTGIRLLFFETHLPEKAVAFANNRFLSFAVCFIFMAGAAYLFDKYTARLRKEEKKASSVLLLLSFLVFLVGGGLEINEFFSQWWLPLFLGFSSLGALWTSLKLKRWPLRAFSYGPLAVGAFYLLFYTDTLLDMGEFKFLFNARALTTIVFAGITGVFLWLMRKNKKLLRDDEELAFPFLFTGINVLLLRLIGVEVLDLFNHQLSGVVEWEESTLENMKNVTLSAAWALYAIVLLVIGIIKKSAASRIFSILVFGFVILKVFLYDTASLNDFYRFVSFAGLGAVLLLAGYLYYRFEDRIMSFIKAENN